MGHAAPGPHFGYCRLSSRLRVRMCWCSRAICTRYESKDVEEARVSLRFTHTGRRPLRRVAGVSSVAAAASAAKAPPAPLKPRISSVRHTPQSLVRLLHASKLA